MKKVVFCLMAVPALACASCGNKNNLYPVTGKVLYRGSPATGAAVFLRRKGGDTIDDHLIMGVVQADGSFELVCGSLGKGAPPGEYDVLIQWRQTLHQGKGQRNQALNQLLARYANPANPLLHAVVAAKNNLLPPFEVTEAGP